MAKVYWLTSKDLFMKVTSKLVEKKVKETFHIQMEKFTQVTLKLIIRMVMQFIPGQTDKDTKVLTKQMWFMVMEFWLNKMATAMKENTELLKLTV